MLTVQKYGCLTSVLLFGVYELLFRGGGGATAGFGQGELGPPGPTGAPGGFSYAQCPVCQPDRHLQVAVDTLHADVRLLQTQVERLTAAASAAQFAPLPAPPLTPEAAKAAAEAEEPAANGDAARLGADGSPKASFRRECSTEPRRTNMQPVVVQSKTRPYVMQVHAVPDIVSKSITEDGTWEPTIVELMSGITNACSRSELLIDVGGNIGFYTTYFASMGHRVISVEPFGLNMPLLMHTVCSNGMEPLVQAFKVALLDQGDMDMCLLSSNIGTNNGNARLMPAWEGVKDFGQTPQDKNRVCQERIRSLTLDYLLFDDPAGAHLTERPLVMKIDIEGSETKALRGAMRLLQSDFAPCFVFFEHQPGATRSTGVSDTEIFKTLEAAGYAINELEWNTTRTHPVSGPTWNGDGRTRDLRADLKLPGTGCSIGEQRCKYAPGV